MRHFLLRPGLHNLAALTVIQGSNALIPLLIVPFAIATVGAGAYAQVAITEAISALVLAAVLYSFDVDGVARLSRTGRDATATAPLTTTGLFTTTTVVKRLQMKKPGNQKPTYKLG